MSHIQLSNPIVSVDWLQEHLHATNLIVLNGTIPKVVSPNYKGETKEIPTTRFFDIKKVFSKQNAPFPNTMLSVAEFSKEAQKLGINNDSAIVVYDELGMYSSPRVWWMFKSMGHDNIAVLNGGFPAWKAQNATCEEKKYSPNTQGSFEGKNQLYLFKNYEEILQEIENTSSLIIDARSEERFSGKVAEPRKGLRSGQIPTSKNLPYKLLLKADHTFKTPQEITAIIESLKTNESELVFSCGSGITACILALGATITGYDSISVYDGSWTEFGTLYK